MVGDVNVNFTMKKLFFGFALLSLCMVQAVHIEVLIDSKMSPTQMLQRYTQFSKQGALKDNLFYRCQPRKLPVDLDEVVFLTGEFLCAYDDTKNMLYIVTQSDTEKKIWFVKNAQGDLELYSEKKHGGLYWLNESFLKLTKVYELSQGQTAIEVISAQKVTSNVKTYLQEFDVREIVSEIEPRLSHIGQAASANIWIKRPAENFWKGPALNTPQHAKVLVKKHKISFIVGGIVLLAGGIAYKLWNWCKSNKEKKNSNKLRYS